MYTMVLVKSFLMNILYRNREPTLRLWKGIMRFTLRFYFRTIILPYCSLYVNNMPQAVKSNLFLYPNDSCLTYQQRC